MKKFVLAGICTLAMVGFVVAEDLVVIITKVDGNSISYYMDRKVKDDKVDPGAKKKGSPLKKGDGDEIKGTASTSVKVSKGTFNPDTKMLEFAPLEGGLKADIFKNISDKGQKATITIADDGADKGKITEVKIGVGGGKGGKGKGGGGQ